MQAQLKNLRSNLNQALDTYSEEVKAIISTTDVDDSTKYLAEQIARQTFYTLGSFKNEIIQYLSKI